MSSGHTALGEAGTLHVDIARETTGVLTAADPTPRTLHMFSTPRG